MGITSGIREAGFNLVDRLKGSPVNGHIHNLAFMAAHPEELERQSERRVRDLLRHAVQTTPFYGAYSGAASLGDFPVISKRVIKERYRDFLSTSYNKADLVSVKTSGSYGTPFTFQLTRQKRARQTAEIIYFSRWAGFRVGMKHALYETRSKSKLELFLSNQLVMSTARPDATWMDRQRHALRTGKVEAMIGMASLIATVARYCESKGDTPKDFGIKAILFGGDLISQSEIDVIEKTFGCPPLSRYATIELGVLAQQCPEHRKHHINSASFHVEILSLNSDEPAPPGQLGRVVVTDLYSHAMPLIRYETGDLAIASDGPCSCGRFGPTLESIDGRSYEKIYDTKGREVRIHMFIKFLENVVQFQFVQTDRTAYEVNLCILPSYNKAGQEKKIRDALKSNLGDDADISINYVSSIERLPSGKRPFVINRYARRVKSVTAENL